MPNNNHNVSYIFLCYGTEQLINAAAANEMDIHTIIGNVVWLGMRPIRRVTVGQRKVTKVNNRSTEAKPGCLTYSMEQSP
jgi:hypothetical protein